MKTELAQAIAFTLSYLILLVGMIVYAIQQRRKK